MPDDSICIHGLSASTRIGVPPEERALPQRVKFTVRLWPQAGLEGLGDEFSRTVDYDAASRLLRETAATGERRLLESLAEDSARVLLERFPLRKVRVEVLKFILPDTEAVSVCITREGPAGRV